MNYGDGDLVNGRPRLRMAVGQSSWVRARTAASSVPLLCLLSNDNDYLNLIEFWHLVKYNF